MESKFWKPMLAAKPDPEDLDDALAQLRYPLLGSPKYDGIRATVQDGKLYSRSLKLIPNLAMQAIWGCKELEGLDGEIIVGPQTAPDCFNRSTSAVMSRDKPADGAVFFVFDRFDTDRPYDDRLYYGVPEEGSVNNLKVAVVKQKPLRSLKELLAFEARMIALGHEGIMLRDPSGAYKQGRSTLKEGGLIAVKRFVDAEAVVLDTYEQEENRNEKTVNELGNSKRSTHKANKVGKGTLGGFTVAMLSGSTLTAATTAALLQAGSRQQGAFNIGTGVGLTEQLRKQLWQKRKSLVGKVIKFRYQKVGTKDAPRLPVFLGFRDGRDL